MTNLIYCKGPFDKYFPAEAVQNASGLGLHYVDGKVKWDLLSTSHLFKVHVCTIFAGSPQSQLNCLFVGTTVFEGMARFGSRQNDNMTM